MICTISRSFSQRDYSKIWTNFEWWHFGVVQKGSVYYILVGSRFSCGFWIIFSGLYTVSRK